MLPIAGGHVIEHSKPRDRVLRLGCACAPDILSNDDDKLSLPVKLLDLLWVGNIVIRAGQRVGELHEQRGIVRKLPPHLGDVSAVIKANAQYLARRQDQPLPFEIGNRPPPRLGSSRAPSDNTPDPSRAPSAARTSRRKQRPDVVVAQVNRFIAVNPDRPRATIDSDCCDLHTPIFAACANKRKRNRVGGRVVSPIFPAGGYRGGVNTTPYELAALAVAAVDGLEAVGVRGPYTRTADFQYGGVVDAKGRRWIVKYPLHSIAGTMIEAEAAIAPPLITALRDGRLPFDVVRPAGFVQVKEGRAVTYVAPMGREHDFEDLTEADAHELGRALAAIHQLPVETIENAGLPSYDTQTSRRRLLADLHDADATSPLPGILRRRWENALEITDLWDFEPRVVHGDIGSDQFMWWDGSISCVLGFGSAHVGDPALDFASLVSVLDEHLFDALVESYSNAMGEEPTENFYNRVVLISELALARWMLFGARRGDAEIVDEARAMMDDLAAEVEADPDLAPGPTWSVSQATPAYADSADDAGFTTFDPDGLDYSDDVDHSDGLGYSDDVGSGDESLDESSAPSAS